MAAIPHGTSYEASQRCGKARHGGMCPACRAWREEHGPPVGYRGSGRPSIEREASEIAHGTTYTMARSCAMLRRDDGTRGACPACRAVMKERREAAANERSVDGPTDAELGTERLRAAGRKFWAELKRDVAAMPRAVPPLRVACGRCPWEHVAAPDEAIQAARVHREAHYGPPV